MILVNVVVGAACAADVSASGLTVAATMKPTWRTRRENSWWIPMGRQYWRVVHAQVAVRPSPHEKGIASRQAGEPPVLNQG